MIVLLADTSALAYRAYYTTGGLSYGDKATGISYGVFYSILQLAEQFSTNRFLFCCDSKESKRRDLFPEYKSARRDNLTDEQREERKRIHQNIDALRDVLVAAGFPTECHSGYEADDVIARVAIDCRRTQFIGVSGDNDLFQLLRFANYHQYSPTSNKLWTASSFQQEYGIPARDWVMTKCIAGCDGDGVPGIPGIGIKTAIKYLQNELTKGKKFDSIVAQSGIIRRNYKLVTLPFPGLAIPPPAFRSRVEISSLLDLFSDLDFQSFLTPEMKRRWEDFCNLDK